MTATNRTSTSAADSPRLRTAKLMKDEAYSEIKKRILNGTYPPGSFLAERQLAEELKMSKTPVKAALERLEHDGYITVSPQQGILVRSLSVGEIADLYEIRTALETFVARTLAGRLTTNQITRLNINLDAQKSKLKKPMDAAECVELDHEFHLLFPEFLGNQEILRVLRQLRDKMGMVVYRIFEHHIDRMKTSYDEHVAIVQAVIDGEAQKAVKLVENHLETGKLLILTRR